MISPVSRTAHLRTCLRPLSPAPTDGESTGTDAGWGASGGLCCRRSRYDLWQQSGPWSRQTADQSFNCRRILQRRRLEISPRSGCTHDRGAVRGTRAFSYQRSGQRPFSTVRFGGFWDRGFGIVFAIIVSLTLNLTLITDLTIILPQPQSKH